LMICVCERCCSSETSSFLLRVKQQKNFLLRNFLFQLNQLAQLCFDHFTGEQCHIKQSVIGRNCRIGRNVTIIGSYLHDNVTIQVCYNVTIQVFSYNLTIQVCYIGSPFRS
jgi:ADP-glucose pyrophosphorylase